MIFKSKPLDNKKGDTVAVSYILHKQAAIATITHISRYQQMSKYPYITIACKVVQSQAMIKLYWAAYAC